MNTTRNPLLLCFAACGLVVPVAASAAGTPAPEPDPIVDDTHGEDTTHRIVQGEITQGWPAVVALMEQGEPVCTGTLVAPRVVLTAAHCLEYGGPDTIYFGNTPAAGGGEEVGVRDSIPHPRYASPDGDTYYDIGVVTLDADGPVDPVPVRRADVSGLVGEEILYVGFGETQGTGGDGFKKQATAEIEGFYGDVMDVQPKGGSACYGDSGGPVLFDSDLGWEIVGVTSFGYTDDCMALGGNTRADLYFDWLQQHSDGLVDSGSGDPAGDSGSGDPAGDDPDDDDGLADAFCQADPEGWSDADWDAWEDGACDDLDDDGGRGGRGCQASFLGSGASAPAAALLALLVAPTARRRRG